MIWERLGKIASDESLAHELAIGGVGGEILEAICEAGEDLADIGYADLAADGSGAVHF